MPVEFLARCRLRSAQGRAKRRKNVRARRASPRSCPRSPDAVIDTDPGTLRALVFSDKKLAGAPVAIRGDTRLARTFFRLFARP